MDKQTREFFNSILNDGGSPVYSDVSHTKSQPKSNQKVNQKNQPKLETESQLKPTAQTHNSSPQSPNPDSLKFEPKAQPQVSPVEPAESHSSPIPPPRLPSKPIRIAPKEQTPITEESPVSPQEPEPPTNT